MKDDLAAMKAVIGLTAEQAKETAVMDLPNPKENIKQPESGYSERLPKTSPDECRSKIMVPKAMEAHLSPAILYDTGIG